MNENPSISSLKKNGKSILIDWSDGEQSKFNFLWLRDNCPSEVHPTARERTFNLLNVSENIHPKAFTINDKGQLEIEWSEGGHISHYDVEWLRHNCYTMKSKKKYSSPYFLWDNSTYFIGLHLFCCHRQNTCFGLTGYQRFWSKIWSKI